jgi:hypothetical protein
VQKPLAIFSSLLSLKPQPFGLVEEAKFEKLSDLHSFVVEEVARLVKKIYTFSLLPRFSERELI